MSQIQTYFHQRSRIDYTRTFYYVVQKYADVLAASKKFQHSHTPGLGENLFYAQYSCIIL